MPADEILHQFNKYKDKLSLEITTDKNYFKINLNKKNKNVRVKLDKIFEYHFENDTIKQLIYEIFYRECYDYAINEKDDKDYQYFLNYVNKLHDKGMKFYWIHLIEHNSQLTYHLDQNFIDQHNHNLIKVYGIEDPNYILIYDAITNNGLTYLPLVALNKTYEAFFDPIYIYGQNLYYIYKDIINYLDIGCNPHYKLQAWYSAGSFIKSMAGLVNPSYVYQRNDINNISLTNLNKFLKDNDSVKNDKSYYVKDYNDNLLFIKFIELVSNEYKNRYNYNINLNVEYKIID